MNLNVWYAGTKEIMNTKHMSLWQLFKYAYHRRAADRLADKVEEELQDEAEEMDDGMELPEDLDEES